eukprot:TRINITY_DN15827_c0_g4_i1.p1 TRINITY_DN15827_c0_g4~~TRINITY_DN15827_c0_g4_i1.p1  ORF type:complete len:1169 (+),score=366.64 TRINITY_DN15827_c0_g4_i1:386-3892(+)
MVILLVLWVPVVTGFWLCFSEMGYGATVFRYLCSHGTEGAEILAGAVFFLCILYLLDVSYWAETGSPLWKTMQWVMVVACAIAVLIGVIMRFRTVPYAPLCAYAVLMPGYFFAIKKRFFPVLNVGRFLRPMAFATFVTGFSCLAISLLWVWQHNFFWSDDTKCEYAARLRVCKMFRMMESREAALNSTNFTSLTASCNADLRNETLDVGRIGLCWTYGESGRACLPGCEEDPALNACVRTETHCLAAFLLWASQFIFSIALIVFSGILFFIAQALRPSWSKGRGYKSFAYFIAFMLLLMWVAASIGGSNMELSNVLVAVSFLGLIITFTVAGASIGWDTLKDQMSGVALMKKMGAIAQSDWTRALVILCVWPLILMFFMASWLNQKTRRRFHCTKFMDSEEERLSLTKLGDVWWKRLASWRWTSVLCKMVMWGFAYFVLVVGVGKIVVLFMSWLNKKLEGVSILIITLVLIGVGLAMFLLPPVPGIPVYLTSGVMLGKSGEDTFGSFPAALLYASLIAFLLKLMAIAAQQKLIGAKMGHKVKVRSFVGINSMSIRAIRHILQRPGMSMDKVAILVGGPDWPTSVLTGILGMSLPQMLLGSCPVLVPLSLTVVAGACMLKADSGGTWESLASVFQVLASGAQATCTFAALSAIATTVEGHEEDIGPPPLGKGVPDDEEVKKEDDAAARAQNILDYATRWGVVPSLWRGILGLSAILMWLSFVIFAFNGSACWEAVQVTTDMDGEPLNGNLLNIIKMPLGYGGLALHFAALILYKIFKCWVGRAVRAADPDEAERWQAEQGSPLLAVSTPPLQPEPIPGGILRKHSASGFVPQVQDSPLVVGRLRAGSVGSDTPLSTVQSRSGGPPDFSGVSLVSGSAAGLEHQHAGEREHDDAFGHSAHSVRSATGSYYGAALVSPSHRQRGYGVPGGRGGAPRRIPNRGSMMSERSGRQQRPSPVDGNSSLAESLLLQAQVRSLIRQPGEAADLDGEDDADVGPGWSHTVRKAGQSPTGRGQQLPSFHQQQQEPQSGTPGLGDGPVYGSGAGSVRRRPGAVALSPAMQGSGMGRFETDRPERGSSQGRRRQPWDEEEGQDWAVRTAPSTVTNAMRSAASGQPGVRSVPGRVPRVRAPSASSVYGQSVRRSPPQKDYQASTRAGHGGRPEEPSQLFGHT